MYEDGEANGVSVPTLKRACTQIGVLKFKLQDEGWVWQHPSDMTPIPEAARSLNPQAMERKGRERERTKGSTPEPAEAELDFSETTKVQVGGRTEKKGITGNEPISIPHKRSYPTFQKY
jgi:hypothetical protein